MVINKEILMFHKQPESIIKKILSIALPVITLAAVAIYIVAVSTLDVAVRATLNGEPLGFVDSAKDITLAKERINELISEATDGDYTAYITVDYELVHTRSPELMTKEEVVKAVEDRFNDIFCEAYMLYVDGEQIGAHESAAALAELVGGIEDDLLAERIGFDSINITSEIRIEKQLCLKSMLLSIDEINEIIHPLESAQTSDEDRRASIMAQIDVISTSPPQVAPTVEALTEKYADPSRALSYNFVEVKTVREVIHYATVYVEDPKELAGTEEIVSEGSDGECHVTYELHYDEEGTLVARKVLSEQIISESQDKVIKVGTMVIPDPVPTGTFIWPCATPHGISSPYGPREVYGKWEFHLGIDLPDLKGSPIYASDGGKVIWTGTTPSYGNSVRIEHANGFVTLYAHLDTIIVAVGDDVYQGQQIATMGSTGMSYGPHLHFEVRINDVNYDPEEYLPELVIE